VRALLPTRPHAGPTRGHAPFQRFPPGAQSDASGIPTRPQRATRVRGSRVSHPPRRTSSAFCSSHIFPFCSQRGGKQAPSLHAASSSSPLPGGIRSLSAGFLSASFSTAPWRWWFCHFVSPSPSLSLRFVHVALSTVPGLWARTPLRVQPGAPVPKASSPASARAL